MEEGKGIPSLEQQLDFPAQLTTTMGEEMPPESHASPLPLTLEALQDLEVALYARLWEEGRNRRKETHWNTKR